VGSFSGQQGFSLLEVIIIAGIVAALSLLSAQMLNDMNRNLAASRSRSDFFTLLNLVDSALRGNITCGNAFGVATGVNKINFGAASSPVVLSINGLQVGGGSSYGQSLTNIQAALTLTDPGEAGNGSLVGRLVKARLVITAQKVVSGIAGIGMSSAKVSSLPLTTFQVAAESGIQTILSCTGLNLNNSGNLSLSNCPVGSVPVTTGTLMKCVIMPATGTCPTGYLTNGQEISAVPAGTPGSVAVGSGYYTGCVAVPNCSVTKAINYVNGTDSNGNSLAATIRQVPVPVWNGRVVSEYVCGYLNCPAGAAEIYYSSPPYNSVISDCIEKEEIGTFRKF